MCDYYCHHHYHYHYASGRHGVSLQVQCVYTVCQSVNVNMHTAPAKLTANNMHLRIRPACIMHCPGVWRGRPSATDILHNLPARAGTEWASRRNAFNFPICQSVNACAMDASEIHLCMVGTRETHCPGDWKKKQLCLGRLHCPGHCAGVPAVGGFGVA